MNRLLLFRKLLLAQKCSTLSCILLRLVAAMNLDGGAQNQRSATARSRRLASSNATPLVASDVRPLAHVRTTYFTAGNDGFLSADQGDLLELLHQHYECDGRCLWIYARCAFDHGRKGWFPASHVVPPERKENWFQVNDFARISMELRPSEEGYLRGDAGDLVDPLRRPSFQRH